MLSYTPTPIQEIHDADLQKADVRLFIKREDLNHPYVTGNKWWKLKYNLEEAKRQGKNTLLTFGGAYSNHIYATAAAAQETGFKSVGIIRGEEIKPHNATLSFARKCGMELVFISREDYRKKQHPGFIEKLNRDFNEPYILPEGGSNELAVKGIVEFTQSLAETNYDYLCAPVGTGGTLAGLILGSASQKKIIGFPVLKGGDLLKADVDSFLKNFSLTSEYSRVPEKISDVLYGNYELDASYHHGGYGKVTKELMTFLRDFEKHHGFRLDPVYTGKMMFGIIDRVKRGMFHRGTTILSIHTGGLQGWSGILERYGKIIP